MKIMKKTDLSRSHRLSQHKVYVIAAEAPAPEAPLAGSVHRGGLHGFQSCYGPYVDDQAILQSSDQKRIRL